jgi:hypothetical protein
MALKKNCKQAQDSMLEEPVEDRVVSPESIGEEEPRIWEDQDEPESEEEQRSSVLFTPKQLEVLLKMNRPDFGELVAAFKTGTSKGERFQLAKPSMVLVTERLWMLGLQRWMTIYMPPRLDNILSWSLPNPT